jgi:hypothetical protein
MDNAEITRQLGAEEIALLQDASKASQVQDHKAEEFREMLIARDCITSNTTYAEFIKMNDLVKAIKLSWYLGYSDEKKPDNFSGGLMSDFEFIQTTPKKGLKELG